MGIQKLPPELDRLALNNIKAAYVSINLCLPCLQAFRIDFTSIKTDDKKQKLAIKTLVKQVGDDISDLNKLNATIDKVLRANKMDEDLKKQCDQMIHIIYDMAIMNDKNFKSVITLFDKIKQGK